MRICHAHCPKPEGGSGLLAVVVAAAVAVGLVVAFVVAHALVLVLGSAGVLAVTGGGVWALHRFATIACGRDALRAIETSRRQLPAPSFRELADRQPAAIPARRPVVTATVISSTNTRTGRTRQWPPRR